MGPGSRIPRDHSSVNPPFFSSSADLPEWRKKVRHWFDLIEAAHDSGVDLTYHSLLKLLVKPCILGAYLVSTKPLLMNLKTREPYITLKQIILSTLCMIKSRLSWWVLLSLLSRV